MGQNSQGGQPNQNALARMQKAKGAMENAMGKVGGAMSQKMGQQNPQAGQQLQNMFGNIKNAQNQALGGVQKQIMGQPMRPMIQGQQMQRRPMQGQPK